MKTLNRSGSDKKIQWIAKNTSSENVTKTVLRFKDLVLRKGTSAFNDINKELKLKSPRSYKVKLSEISKAELLVSDNLKQSILKSAANLKIICESHPPLFNQYGIILVNPKLMKDQLSLLFFALLCLQDN